MSNRRDLIVVLGMHRSGTSCVAVTLARCGIQIGDNLMAPKPDNPRGFYEDLELVEANEDMLRAMGAQWEEARALPGAGVTGWLARRLRLSRVPGPASMFVVTHR